MLVPWGYARGGMGSITQAMSKSLLANGGNIKAGSAVKNILIKNNRTYGLALENGDEIYADKIVSNLDVKRTFLKVVEKKELPSEFYTAVKNFKIRGSSGKLNIALDDKPIWKSIPKDDPASTGDLHFTQSIEEMEGAYDDWKDGKWSTLPYVDMCIPTLNDPTWHHKENIICLFLFNTFHIILQMVVGRKKKEFNSEIM